MTPETDAMGRLNLSGNITPAIWYSKILMPQSRKKSGVSKRKPVLPKPDHVAVTILSEICWWYRPQEVRDEQDNRVGWERKFHADILQLSPKQLSKKFGFSAKQCQRALARLEALGLIKRKLRDVPTAGGTLGNICFIRLFPVAVGAITWPTGHDDSATTGSYPLDTGVHTSGPGCPNITENTYGERKKTPKSPERGLNPLPGKRNRRNPETSLSRDWVRDANADPVAQEFLGLIGRNDFAQEGQRLARCFVKGRSSGRVSDEHIHLVARMRAVLPLPKTLDDILGGLDGLAANAREMAEAELENLAVDEAPGSEEIAAKKNVLGAAIQFVAVNPDPALSLENHLAASHPLWALLMAHEYHGSNLSPHLKQCRDPVIIELASDTAARAFLSQNELDVENILGVQAGKIQTAADEVQNHRRSRMEELRRSLISEPQL